VFFFFLTRRRRYGKIKKPRDRWIAHIPILRAVAGFMPLEGLNRDITLFSVVYSDLLLIGGIAAMVLGVVLAASGKKRRRS